MGRSRGNYGIIGAKATDYLYNQPKGMVDITGLGLFNSKFLMEIYCWGAGGAGGTVGGWSFGAAGGAGGAAFGILPVTGATSFIVMVGGPGIVNASLAAAAVGGGGAATINDVDNRYAGGGGGLSGVFAGSYAQANSIIIAGGGGGGGASRAGTGNAGGGGGGTIGEQGYSPYDGKAAYGGGGGTQSAGGTGTGGGSGSALQGGANTTQSYGGGGGGGYWGGAGGGYSESNTMGGGGGGSGYLRSSIINGALSVGVGTTPGDSGNALRGSYGNAGAVASNGTQGVVIIQYPGLPKGTGGTITTVGQYTRHTFTTTGQNPFNLFL